MHKELEAKLSEFLGTDDTILYSSCFDANGGLFETLLGAEDAIISDALNHASIIDGVRLSKAQRFRYANNDMADLEKQLQAAAGLPLPHDRHRRRVLDGRRDRRPAAVCDLADKYDALVMVDDSHAVGFVGPRGRGTPELAASRERVDIITGTLGKALGGASGGYTSGRKEIVDWLRQRSRPYLFSNSLAAADRRRVDRRARTCSTTATPCGSQLHDNMQFFRAAMTKLGFKLLGARARDHSRACSATRSSPARWPRRCSKKGCTSSASRTRSCRKDRPAFARKCRRPTRARTWSSPSRVRESRPSARRIQ